MTETNATISSENTQRIKENAFETKRINKGFFNLRRAQDTYRMCQASNAERYLRDIPKKPVKTENNVIPSTKSNTLDLSDLAEI